MLSVNGALGRFGFSAVIDPVVAVGSCDGWQ